jgi:hypothetical protein
MSAVPKIAYDAAVIELAEKAKAAIYDEKGLKNKAISKRVESGIYLLALQSLIDEDRARSDGMTFWQFFDYIGFGISAGEARKRLAIAKADNPEAALDAVRKANREGMAQSRAHVGAHEPEQDQPISRRQVAEEDELQPDMDGVASLLVEQAWAIVKRMSRNEKLELLERLQDHMEN